MIFRRPEDLPIIELVKDKDGVPVLDYLGINLRNTAAIHEFAVKRTKLGQTSTPFIFAGKKPLRKRFTAESDSLKFIIRQLDKLFIENEIPNEKVTILSNRKI